MARRRPGNRPSMRFRSVEPFTVPAGGRAEAVHVFSERGADRSYRNTFKRTITAIMTQSATNLAMK
jgi:hypothetical protein